MKKYLLWLLALVWSVAAFGERTITYGSLRVCAQNLENFYVNTNTGRGNYTPDQINAKAAKIVNMMLTVNADIYAFCEVEAKPEVLQYLASQANALVSGNPYVAVSDGINEEWDATYNNNIKSGFIYRSDRVQPVGSNTAASSANYYRNTMRYQAFQQLSNGEKLVVSMNHFKAKDSSADQGNATRLNNASSLINALSSVSTDPDILILGDLNCKYGESPITYITNAGYSEQLLRFDSTSYSHCYGGGELIDHVLANSSMQNQIVDAYVRHMSTTCSIGVTDEMSYSDHDPYVVEINLSSPSSSITTCAAAREAALSVSANNELYNNGAVYSIRGFVTSIQTAYNPSYGNITFWMADTQNGGKVLEAYRCSADASAVPNVGDYVEVTGNLTKYGSTPEFASGCSCQVIYTSAPPVNLGAKTIYEFLQLKNIKDTCVLTGIVENIVMDSEDTTQYNKFGNFYINDGTGSLYIYGLLTADGQTQQFRTMGIDEGDTLTLKAVYAEYNSNPQAANSIYVSHSKFVSTNWGPVTVKLDPSSTTMYSWNQVGIWAWVTNGTKSTDLFEQWPGVPVTIDPETGWWSYTFNNIPSGQLNIIWNDYGYYGYQTSDIENVTENTCYKLTGTNYSCSVTECIAASAHDTLNIVNLANYIDFQALYSANHSMTDTAITSYSTVTLPNGSVLRGFLKSDDTEAPVQWNIKNNYNTPIPTPKWDGVDALIAGTMLRAGAGSSISLGAFTMNSSGKLTVYFQPNGDAERGVSIAVKGYETSFAESGVKIDGTRPAYAAEVNLPAGYYDEGDVVITVITNTINIFGVRIAPEPVIGPSTPSDSTTVPTYTVYLSAPQGAPESIEIIGSFDYWSGTAMTSSAGLWTATITALPTDEFKFREAGNWNNEIQFYDANDGWYNPSNFVISNYIIDAANNIVYADFSDANLYRWTPSGSETDTTVVPTPVEPEGPNLTVAEAKNFGSTLADGDISSKTYTIRGYVAHIEQNLSGYMSFFIDDVMGGENRFYVYLAATATQLHVGDYISVTSRICKDMSTGLVQTEATSPATLITADPLGTISEGILDFTAEYKDISQWTILNASRNSATDESNNQYVYDLSAGVTGATHATAEPHIIFRISNNADKTSAFMLNPGKFYQFGGKNGVIVVRNTMAGDIITLYAASKGSSDASFLDPNGVYPYNAVALTEDLTLPARNNGHPDQDASGYVWRQIRYQSTGGDVKIKEFNAGYRLRAISIARGEVDTTQTMTVSDAIRFGNLQIANTESPNKVSVTGYVISAEEFDLNYGTQSFFIADNPYASTGMKAYLATPLKEGAEYPVLIGDRVTINGPIEHYINANTGEDFVELVSPTVAFLEEADGDRTLGEITEITVADAMNIGYNLGAGKRTRAVYEITGYVSAIEEDAMDTYGNMTFWLAEAANGAASNEDGAFYVYRGVPDRRLQVGDQVRVRTCVRHSYTSDSTSTIIQSVSRAIVTYVGGSTPSDIPTVADLQAAGYNMNNIVLCFHFGYEPCNDVVIAGNYNGWTTEPSECVRMSPLAGFDGWYAAQIPYNTNGGTWDNQAKPLQLANDDSFNWEYQAGDVNAWIHRGGNETEFEMFANECTPYLSNPGAYIYEIAYWKNHNNPCNEIKSNYDVYLSAPQNAPSNIELIGSFDNWTGTPMTNIGEGFWMATISASPSDYFMFREAGTWDNRILVYDSVIDDWTVLTNCMIGDYIISDATVYADFSNPNTYRWTTSGSGSDTSAVTDPIELTIASIRSTFYTEDNDIWYHLYLEDDENYFNIDIIVPEGMRDVELGHVYTWSDMLQQYCGGYYNGANISYSDVQFVKTQTAGGVYISATVTATTGQQYILTYVGADTTPFDYDAEYSFTENFATYSDFVYDAVQRSVTAVNGNDGAISLLFNLPTGTDTLVAGIYPIDATGNPMTVKASEGLINGSVTRSYACYYDEEGYITIPLWYLVSGIVMVADDGTIYVDAYNSKGARVQCQLTKGQEPPQPEGTPTEADLIAAGYNTTNNVVLAYKFDVAPCYDVVIAGTYMMDSTGAWIADPSQLVHMAPLAGFDGWYAAQIPYDGNTVQAKPVQLTDIGGFNWDNQAGGFNAWIYRGGNEAYIENGYDNEVNVYYESPGAYIYEIAYWKNNNNPCTSLTTTYTVFLEAPQNAPDSIEIIGSFDNWTGTLMTYDAQTGFWTATITATPSDVFKFRQAGNWDNEILVYNSAYDAWTTLPNLVISQYLYDNIVYCDFDNAELYRWTNQDDESDYYIPYNLQAVSEPGKVVFTWDAEMISDSYALHIYDVNDNDRYLGYLLVQGVTTFTYMVEDFLDGKEIRWSLEPQSPYLLDEVFAPNTVVMQKSQVELSNFNLLTADGITLDLTWQSNVPVLQYIVEVQMGGNILREETVTSAEFHYTSPIPGVMDVYICPLNAEGEAVGRYAYAGSIELSAVPEPFKNLQAVANGHDINATWEGAADSVYLQLYHMVDGEFTDIVYQSVVAGHSFTYTVEEDGNYAVQLRAWTELSPGQYGRAPYADYVVVQVFTVPTYAIQIDASEGGYIFPSGLSGNYPVGYTLNAYAYPNEGYRFVGWSDGVEEAERTITVQGAMSITAQFEALSVYTVSVQASEGGWIYVSGDMSSYDVSYTGQWYEDSQTTIYASAADGYSFYQWSDGVTNAQRTVNVNSNINLTAIFMPDCHLMLAVNSSVMGEVTVTGDYNYADGIYTTAYGAVLTIAAQPYEGYRFVIWSDGVQTISREVTLTQDMTLTATFEQITTPIVQYAVSVSAGTGGSVNNVSSIYNAGDIIQLVATPDEGYEFTRWSDGNTANPRMLTVTENKTLMAIFSVRTVTLSVIAGQGGMVAGTTNGTFDYGTAVNFWATPNEHYRFAGWSDGVSTPMRSVTLVRDTVITASFAAIPLYTLNITAAQGGQIRVDNEAYTSSFTRAYDENTSVVVEAQANAGYVFTGWSDGDTNALRVIAMNSDVTLTAEFLPIYTLTIFANNGSVLVQGDAEATANNVYKAAAGTVLTLTAQPAEGYRFVSWSDGVQTISRVITLTSNTFLVATFEVASSTPQYTVTVGVTGTGTGTVNGQTSISTLYYENDQVPLTALAGESSQFVGWSDGVTSTTRTLVVTSDTILIAIFNYVQPVVQYTVTFKNYDGTILEENTWNEGDTPTCSVTPTRPDDEENTYSFAGWTPEIAPVTANAVYTAVFEATPVVLPSFTVTFYDWDDSVISSETVTQGGSATLPADPTRAGYVFVGWDGNYTNVQHNEAVFAMYRPAEEGIDDVLDGNNAVKIFREGQIFILRGDKTYTLDGQIVR